MGEVLPYLNVFPNTETEEGENLKEELPQEEGLHSPQEEETGETQEGETQEERKPFQTDEFVEAGDSGVPERVPEDPNRETEAMDLPSSSAETATEETTPVQEESASEREETQG